MNNIWERVHVVIMKEINHNISTDLYMFLSLYNSKNRRQDYVEIFYIV
jgi:hypothetical protein